MPSVIKGYIYEFNKIKAFLFGICERYSGKLKKMKTASAFRTTDICVCLLSRQLRITDKKVNDKCKMK